MDSPRVIALIDLDCFYAQVEQVRLGLPPDVPLAVQQYNALIAVNYAARKFGISRMLSATEAKKKCPDLVCAEVEMLDGKVSLQRYRDARTTILFRTYYVMPSGLANYCYLPLPYSLNKEENLPRVIGHYCALCSMQIMNTVQAACGSQVVLQKMSVDEMYVDMTAAVEAEFRAAGGVPHGWTFAGAVLDKDGAIDKAAQPEIQQTHADALLLIGSVLVDRVRRTVHEKLSMTCSAGIAHNRIVAKIIASYCKPNGQCSCPESAVSGTMKGLELRKVPGLGGKLGRQLAYSGMRTTDDVTAVSAEQLQAYGFSASTARWARNRCLGIDDSAVEARLVNKQLLSCKSFDRVTDEIAAARWMHTIAAELAPRIRKDADEHARVPERIVLHVRNRGQAFSKSGSAPVNLGDPASFRAVRAGDARGVKRLDSWLSAGSSTSSTTAHTPPEHTAGPFVAASPTMAAAKSRRTSKESRQLDQKFWQKQTIKSEQAQIAAVAEATVAHDDSQPDRERAREEQAAPTLSPVDPDTDFGYVHVEVESSGDSPNDDEQATTVEVFAEPQRQESENVANANVKIERLARDYAQTCPPEEDLGSSAMQLCATCGDLVPLLFIQEHSDRHFAEQLQKEEQLRMDRSASVRRAADTAGRATAPRGARSGKRKAAQPSSNHSLARYFAKQ